jgi:hypothetical protein
MAYRLRKCSKVDRALSPLNLPTTSALRLPTISPCHQRFAPVGNIRSRLPKIAPLPFSNVISRRLSPSMSARAVSMPVLPPPMIRAGEFDLISTSERPIGQVEMICWLVMFNGLIGGTSHPAAWMARDAVIFERVPSCLSRCTTALAPNVVSISSIRRQSVS